MGVLLTKEEAARLLGLSVARVRQLRSSGELHALVNPVTKRVRFCQSEVLDYKHRREIWLSESA